MAKKSAMRRKKAAKSRRSMKRQDLKFQASLDASYGLTGGELFNMVRSYGGSKREASSIVGKMFGRRR